MRYLALFLLPLLLLISSAPAEAQEQTERTYIFLDGSDGGGWTILQGTNSSLWCGEWNTLGVRGVYQCDWNNRSSVYLQYTFATPVNIDSVRFQVSSSITFDTYRFWLYNESWGTVRYINGSNVAFTTPYDTGYSYYTSESGTWNNVKYLRFYITENTTFYVQKVYITANHPPEHTLIMPLSPGYISYDGFNHPEVNSSLTITGDTNIYTNVGAAQAPVYPAENMTITNIERVYNTKAPSCYDYMGVDILARCTVVIPPEITGGSQSNLYTDLNPFSVDANYWKISATGTENALSYEYIVSNPRVAIGQSVTTASGCYIGEAYNASGSGAVSVRIDGGSEDTLEWFSVEPADTGSPCDAPPEYEQCIGGALTNDPTKWSNYSSANWMSDRVILAAGGFIEKSVSLPAGDPFVYVFGRSIGGDTQANIQLRQVTDSSNITSSNVLFPIYWLERSSTITLADTEIVTLRITNIGDYSLELKSACLTVAEAGSGVPGAPEAPPNPDEDSQSGCNLTDYKMNDPSSWSTSGGIHSGGEWRLDSGDSISQNVDLVAATYHITVLHRAAYLANVTLDIQDNTDNALIEINLGAGWITLDTVTEQDYATYQNSVTSTASYVLGSDYTGSFSIRATISGMSGASIAIMSACISDTPYDTSSDGFAMFNASCGEAINVPSGDSNSVWTQWLWAQFDKFYNCQLMTLLNSMYQLGLQQYETIGWSIRYGQTSFQMSLDWLENSIFPWLAGYFSNMGIGGGQITIIQGEEQCNNLFCFLGGVGELLLSPIQSIVDSLADTIDRLLAILEQGFGLVFDAIAGFIDTAYGILDFLLQVINDIRNLIASFLALWNDTEPAELPFVPSCSTNPQSSGMCVVFWMMENTIFSGTGAVFIPLIISFGSLLALLWAARKLKNAINTAGSMI